MKAKHVPGFAIPQLSKRDRYWIMSRSFDGWTLDVVIDHNYAEDEDEVSIEVWRDGKCHRVLDDNQYRAREEACNEYGVEMGDDYVDNAWCRGVLGYDVISLASQLIDRFVAVQFIVNLEVS